jgi:phospholipid/cholesterol/gamma-HCH transport system substrate-binding protein
MRRAASLLVLLAIAVGVVLLARSTGNDSGSYTVRAYFDNGDFVVNGESVKIAGATVGSVQSTAVSLPGEEVNRDGTDDPGKAAIVLKIVKPGFESWSQDASCLIRPQSLLGEKYIDCKPTQPRAPESPAPAPLKTIPDGKTGAGEAFLPLQNNGKIVDLDLVQNINSLPYAQRFRLILNNLGAGLAARGRDLQKIIVRGDPALRETDQVLATLAKQNKVLSNLARDSDTALAPLAAQRQHLTGFIDNANIAGQATAERSADLESGLSKFPRVLTELRSTMVQLKSFSDQATPVLADLGSAAPSLNQLNLKLAPFSQAAERSFISLGDATAKSTGPLVASQPVIRQLTKLSKSAASPSKNLNKLLASFEKQKGYQQLTDFIYNTAGTTSTYDQYGHFLKTLLVASSCVDYVTSELSGCGAHFAINESKAPAKAPSIAAQLAAAQAQADAAGSVPDAAGDGTQQTPGATGTGGVGVGNAKDLAGVKHVLDFMMGGGSSTGSTAGAAPGAGAAK